MADKEEEKPGTEPETEEQGQEEEYESSDLDDAPLPAVRRRAEASDEEEEDSEEDGGRPLPRRKAGSDADSDGQGAAEEYGEYEDYEEEVYEDFEQGRGGVAPKAVAVAPGDADGVNGAAEAGEEAGAAEGEEGEEGKKESEPFAVPTAGAFYMHDDRFQEARGRGRGRKMLGNRNLWSPKEEQAWVHDRYDEMHPRGYHNGNIRNPRGRARGRANGPGGRTRGVSHGNSRGNRSQTHPHDGNQNYSYVPKGSHVSSDNMKNARPDQHEYGKNRASKPSHAQNDDVDNVVPKESRTYNANSRIHKDTPRVTRGRGSRRYQPRSRNTTEISPEQNNKSQNPENAPSNAKLGRHQPQSSNSQPEQASLNKQSSASNLNSASPPFYPSRPFHPVIPFGQTGNAQLSTTSRPFSLPSLMEQTPQYGPLLRGKAFVPSAGYGKLPVEGAMKGVDNPALHPSTSSSNNQSTPRVPTQMLGARFGSTGEMPSSTQPTSTVLTEDTGISSPRGSNKATTRWTVKGQHGDQGEERASFFYGRGQVPGATGSDHGFHGTPALFPVMQFGGQHPGGPGVPSIGMALPGFVSQQQHGLSNSEMAWLPILAGSAGGLGPTYGSPYIAKDGSYYSRPSEQASLPVSPREPTASNAHSQLKSPEITEVVNDESSRRQSKPRRYSEMKFGQ
ncbi:unnamed protein product [Alopecurus aequalis]